MGYDTRLYRPEAITNNTRTDMAKNLIILILVGLLVGSCSSRLPEPVTTAEINAEPTATLTPTATSTTTPTPTFTPSPTPTITLTPTPKYPEEGYGPADFPADIDPLTGLKLSDPDILQRRPLSIKVNIVPRNNRPPWGISMADIVYDYYHNDGYTRFHAIYYGQDAELVGPIRSARLPDDALVRIYKTIFAYSGADFRINNRLFYSDYSDRLVLEGQQSGCPPTTEHPMCRFDPSGHDFLLGGTQEIHTFAKNEGIDDSWQNLDGMFFQAQTPQGGEPGSQVTTHYSIDNYNRWEYDAQTGKYLRFQDNLLLDQGQEEEFAPLTDRLTEKQITADNVVVLFAPHGYFNRPPSEIIEITFDGSGPAYAFRDGKAYELTWNRPASGGVLYLTFPDGENYPFKPGNTWFEVVGQYTFVTQPEAQSWRFEFQIP